jgi:hypothetical protein
VPVGLANLAEKRSMVVVHGEVCCVFVIQHTITTTSGSQGGEGGWGFVNAQDRRHRASDLA